MFIKAMIIAAGLASAASDTFANNVTESPMFTGYEATVFAQHNAGPFTDTFTFTLPDITSAEVSILSVGLGSADLDFTSATLNGQSLALMTLSDGHFERLFTPSRFSVTGPLTLIIKGSSGSSSFYGGWLNVTTVPEPESLALMMAGLGLLGVVARRRCCHS